MVIEYFLEWISTAPLQKRVEAAGAMVRAYLNDDIDEEERDDVEAAITVLTKSVHPRGRVVENTSPAAKPAAEPLAIAKPRTRSKTLSFSGGNCVT